MSKETCNRALLSCVIYELDLAGAGDTCVKRDVIYVQRDLYICQKRPAKEAYMLCFVHELDLADAGDAYVKRDLYICQKRTMHVCQKICQRDLTHVKRDLCKYIC